MSSRRMEGSGQEHLWRYLGVLSQISDTMVSHQLSQKRHTSKKFSQVACCHSALQAGREMYLSVYCSSLPLVYDIEEGG